MNQVHSLFSVPIFEERLDHPVDEIELLCQQERFKDPQGSKVSNVGGWHSGNINYPDSPFFFLSDIEKNCQVYATNILRTDDPVFLSNVWININSKHDSNMIHSHARCTLSGVYYIKTPKECGNIKFFHPAVDLIVRDWTHSSKEYHPANSITWWLPPSEGTLYIFPSWVKHLVEPNMSDEERISISFNVEMRVKV